MKRLALPILLLCIITSAVYTYGRIYDQPHFVFAANTYEHEQHGFSYGSAQHSQNHHSHLQPRYYTLDQHTITYLLSNNNHELVLSSDQEQLVLSLHHCYDNPQLLTRIKALSEYPAYIKKLYTFHQRARTRLGKAWNHFTGKVPKNLDLLYREIVANEAAAAQSQVLHTPKHQQKACHYNPHAVVHHLHQSPSHERAEALSRAIASHHQLVTTSYCIGNDAGQLLEDSEVSREHFQTCIGDVYQQHIHQELIDTLDQTGMLYIQHRDNLLIHDLTMTLGECSYNGIIANQQHEVLLATQISDFCSALLEFSNALVQGMGDGLTRAAYDGFYSAQATLVRAADACRDPQQAVCNAGHYVFDTVHGACAISANVIERVSQSYMDLLREVHDVVAVCIDDPELGYQLLSTCSEYIHDDIAAGVATIQTTADYLIATAPQWCTPSNLRTVAAFTTEHGVKLAVHHCLAKTYTTIAGHALTYAAKAVHTAGSQILAEGRECFELARVMGTKMASFAETSRQAILSSKYINVTSKFFATHAYEYAELAAWASQLSHMPAATAQVTGLQKIIASERFLQHIFSLELKTYFKKSGDIRQKINGFHAFIEGFLEEHGIQLLNKRVCEKTGIIMADVLCNGYIEQGKTFFPLSWDRKKVIEKIYESLQTLTEPPKLDRGDWVIFGVTQEGITIKTVINVAGELITSFPFNN